MENKVSTVEEYINLVPEDRQEILKDIRRVILEAAPNATESMKYEIPTYHQGKNLVHFANAKNHIGFYPTPSAIEHFKEAFSDYKTSKGTVQFPLNKRIPLDLIAEVTKWRVEQVTK